MRKIIHLLLVLSLCFLVGCSTDAINYETIGTDMSNKILRCLDENDAESLKALFCEEMQNNIDLAEQIETAFNFFDGEVVSYDNISVGSGESVDSGVLTDSHIIPVINGIKTDSEKTYKITFLSYITLAQREQYEGINYIIIREENGDYIMIGEYMM